MPHLAAVSKIDFHNKISQEDVKLSAKEFFVPHFPVAERLLIAFDNTEIRTRNFCKPLAYFVAPVTFEEVNKEFIRCALEYSVIAIEDCVAKAGIQKADITDLIFVSTTGLATPSIDALIINQMKLDPHINRTPVFGLGCAGGVSGYAKANILCKANPGAVVLLVSAELCSLTFMRSDFSKSNFIASSLFSDGIGACIVKGDRHQPVAGEPGIKYIDSRSTLYYDSLDVMGWEFLDSGFKVVFSQDIPSIINKNVRSDVDSFLADHNLRLTDIRNFIFHPGGKKVLTAYEEALTISDEELHNTRATMKEYGNMSSATVLYILEKFVSGGFEDGYGLMLALGPGFSSELVLLDMHKN